LGWSQASGCKSIYEKETKNFEANLRGLGGDPREGNPIRRLSECHWAGAVGPVGPRVQEGPRDDALMKLDGFAAGEKQSISKRL